MSCDNALTEQPGRTQPVGSTVEPARSQRSERSDVTGDDERQSAVETIAITFTWQPHRQRRSSWSERSDVTRNEKRYQANRIGPEGATLEDEARWPRPWAAPQGKIYTR